MAAKRTYYRTGKRYNVSVRKPSDVTVTRADGTVEVVKPYTPRELKVIVKRGKKS